ncbi:acetoacetate decarboxylase family protein [Thermodesulfobacteriota bacterium]
MDRMSFFESAGRRENVVLGDASFDLPILYYRDDLFLAFFPADLKRVRRFLPAESLRPVSPYPGKALVGVAAFNYIETSIGPYGEVAVAIPVVHRVPAPSLLPVILESRYPGFGLFVMHLPVTTLLAREAGRGVWGYPKFTADMHFANSPETALCEMSEGGRHILTLKVAKGGLVMTDNRPLVTYTIMGTDLVRTEVAVRGIYQMRLRPPDSMLTLGNHPVAETVRELGVDPRPLVTRNYIERAAILPRGNVVATGVSPCGGFPGADSDGQLTTSW